MDTIKLVIAFVQANWITISAIIGGVITIINAITESAAKKESKLMKALMWITGTLSFIRSKGDSHPKFGALKIPLVPEKK